MAKHYITDNKEKVIYANILKLTDDELAEISKLEKFGYTVVNEAVAKAKEKLNPDKKTVLRLDEDSIRKYLKEHAEEAIEAFDKEKKDNGYAKAKTWFMKNYPANVKDIEAQTEKADYAKYQKGMKNKTDPKTKESLTPMTEEEYTRYFYWTKVFERK